MRKSVLFIIAIAAIFVTSCTTTSVEESDYEYGIQSIEHEEVGEEDHDEPMEGSSE